MIKIIFIIIGLQIPLLAHGVDRSGLFYAFLIAFYLGALSIIWIVSSFSQMRSRFEKDRLKKIRIVRNIFYLLVTMLMIFLWVKP